MNIPERPDHPMYELLHMDKIEEFNQRRAGGEKFDLRGLDLRAMDLRGLDTDGISLSGSYLKDTDLRGLDLSHVHLEGASMRGAKVSGTLFPRELEATEILLSLETGTRLRYGT